MTCVLYHVLLLLILPLYIQGRNCTGTLFLQQHDSPTQELCTHITDSLLIQERLWTDTLCQQLLVIETIHDTLELSFLETLTSLDCLSSLVAVRSLVIRHNPQLHSLEFTSLSNSSSLHSLHLESCPQITSLEELPQLTQASQLDTVYLRDIPQLTQLSFPHLTQLQSLHLTDMLQLVNLSFPVLWYIAGSATLTLQTVDHVHFFSSLQKVDDSLFFSDWTSLRNINALQNIHDMPTNHALHITSDVCCPPRENNLWKNGWFDITCSVCIKTPIQFALPSFSCLNPLEWFYFAHDGITTSLQFTRTLIWYTPEGNTWPMSCVSFTPAGMWCQATGLWGQVITIPQQLSLLSANDTTSSVWICSNNNNQSQGNHSSTHVWDYEDTMWTESDTPQWIKDNEWIQNSLQTYWTKIGTSVGLGFGCIVVGDIILAGLFAYLIHKQKTYWWVYADQMNYRVIHEWEWDYEKQGHAMVQERVSKTSCGGLMTAIKYVNGISLVLAYHYYSHLNQDIRWSDLHYPSHPNAPNPHTLIFELIFQDETLPCALSTTIDPEYPAGGLLVGTTHMMSPSNITLSSSSSSFTAAAAASSPPPTKSWDAIQQWESQCYAQWTHTLFAPVFNEVAQTRILLPVNLPLRTFGWHIAMSNGQHLWGAQQHDDEDDEEAMHTRIMLGWSVVEEMNKQDNSIHQMSSLRVTAQDAFHLLTDKFDFHLPVSQVEFSIQLDPTIVRIEEKQRQEAFSLWVYSLVLMWATIEAHNILYSCLMWSDRRHRRMYANSNPYIDAADFEWIGEDWNITKHIVDSDDTHLRLSTPLSPPTIRATTKDDPSVRIHRRHFPEYDTISTQIEEEETIL